MITPYGSVIGATSSVWASQNWTEEDMGFKTGDFPPVDLETFLDQPLRERVPEQLPRVRAALDGMLVERPRRRILHQSQPAGGG